VVSFPKPVRKVGFQYTPPVGALSIIHLCARCGVSPTPGLVSACLPYTWSCVCLWGCATLLPTDLNFTPGPCNLSQVISVFSFAPAPCPSQVSELAEKYAPSPGWFIKVVSEVGSVLLHSLSLGDGEASRQCCSSCSVNPTCSHMRRWSMGVGGIHSNGMLPHALHACFLSHHPLLAF
jgi:hypothetical protein